MTNPGAVDWQDLATRMAALLFRSSTICCSTGKERDDLRDEWEGITGRSTGLFSDRAARQSEAGR